MVTLSQATLLTQIRNLVSLPQTVSVVHEHLVELLALITLTVLAALVAYHSPANRNHSH